MLGKLVQTTQQLLILHMKFNLRWDDCLFYFLKINTAKTFCPLNEKLTVSSIPLSLLVCTDDELSNKYPIKSMKYPTKSLKYPTKSLKYPSKSLKYPIKS